ncbi:MAG: hypothetical protein OEV40_09325 [Acidimicrobiia bacterium]|nr:hypothetical protein [Acidimicrobiia bacterium]
MSLTQPIVIWLAGDMRSEGFLEQLNDDTIELLLAAGSRRQLPKGPPMAARRCSI